MNRRRITFGAAVLVSGIVALLLVTHWGTVRDHVEAWRFQLTRETKTIKPFEEGVTPDEGHRSPADDFEVDPGDPTNRLVRVSRNRDSTLKNMLHILANELRSPVNFDPQQPIVLHRLLEDLQDSSMKVLFEENGYRVLEQCFPRRAYVVIREERPAQAEPRVAPRPTLTKHPGGRPRLEPESRERIVKRPK